LVTDNSEPPADLIQALMMRIELIREKSVKEKMTEEQIRKWMDTFSLTQEQVESFDKIARRFAQFQPH
jgi:NAD-dependent DNA ligase